MQRCEPALAKCWPTAPWQPCQSIIAQNVNYDREHFSVVGGLSCEVVSSPLFPEASRYSTGLLTTSGQTRSRLLIVYKMSQVQLWSPPLNKSLSEMQTWGKSCFRARGNRQRGGGDLDVNLREMNLTFLTQIAGLAATAKSRRCLVTFYH